MPDSEDVGSDGLDSGVTHPSHDASKSKIMFDPEKPGPTTQNAMCTRSKTLKLQTDRYIMALRKFPFDIGYACDFSIAEKECTRKNQEDGTLQYYVVFDVDLNPTVNSTKYPTQ